MENKDMSSLQDLHTDFEYARQYWDRLGLDVDFDTAIKMFNNSEYADPNWYAKPIYSEEAWEQMVDLAKASNESLTEGVGQEEIQYNGKIIIRYNSPVGLFGPGGYTYEVDGKGFYNLNNAKAYIDGLGEALNEAKREYIGLDDVDADEYPNLSDALDANLVSLVIYDGVLTNEQFDETGMEDVEIDPLEVKDDIKRFAEHRGLEFQFDYNYSESLNEDEIKRYSDVVPKENRKYWYFTTHGVQPGSVPKGVNILEIRDGVSKNGMSGTFVCLDAVLNTSELKEYNMKEEVPVEESLNEGTDKITVKLSKDDLDGIPVEELHPDYYDLYIKDKGDYIEITGYETNIWNALHPYDLHWRTTKVDENLTEGAMTNGSYSLYNGWVKVPDKDSIPDEYPELEPEYSE